MRPTKSVPVKKVWIFYLPSVYWKFESPWEKFWIANVPQWISEVLIFPRWYCSDSLWSLARSRRHNHVRGYFFDPHIQFHEQFWTTDFCFWLVDILPRKSDASSKDEMKWKKNTIFMMRKDKKTKNKKKHSLFWTHPTDPWCNMLSRSMIQTLARRRNTEVVSFWKMNTLRCIYKKEKIWLFKLKYIL